MKLSCPVCEHRDIRLAHSKGFLEKRVYPLLMLQSYQCQACRSRFHRFRLQDSNGDMKRVKRRKRKAQREQLQEFFQPPDGKEFQELIAQIREAELRIFGEEKRPTNQIDRMDDANRVR